jgi:hypothetical protein
MESLIKNIGFRFESLSGVSGRSIFFILFVLLLSANLMICFARFGCDTQDPQPSPDLIVTEECVSTRSFQRFYREIAMLVVMSAIFLIYTNLFWNAGKTIKSHSGLIRLLIPYFLYNAFVYILEIVWPLLLNVKVSSVGTKRVLEPQLHLDFCPTSGTVGTGVGNVSCKRPVLLSFTDSLVQSLRTLLENTTFANSITYFNAQAVVFVYAIVLGVSAYIHKGQA